MYSSKQLHPQTLRHYRMCHRSGYFNDMIKFLAQVRNGEVDGVKVRLDRLQVHTPMYYIVAFSLTLSLSQALISTSCIDNLEYMVEDDEQQKAHSPPKSAL